MSTVGKLQSKLAELLQINEAMVTHIESLVSERDYFKNGMAELQDIIDKLEPERDALVAQIEALNSKNFELTCYRVDVLRCLKTIAFEHNHSDVSLYQPMARHLMDSISANAELKEVRAEASRAGFVAGYDAGHEYRFSNLGDELADEYAERVKAGEV